MLLGDVLEQAAIKYGERTAVLYDDHYLSFTELYERSKRLANVLLVLASPGDRVAILCQNRPEYLEAEFGVTMAGMGLNFLNYRLNPREIARILAHAEPSVILVENEYVDVVSSIRDEVPSVKTVIGIGPFESADWDGLEYESLLSAASSARPMLAIDEDDLAFLLYTSGTTGAPKGVMLTHRSVLWSMASWLISGTTPPHRGVQLMPFPMCHVAGAGVIGNVIVGATLVLRRSYEPEDAMRLIDRHQITGAPFAPTMLDMLLRHPKIDAYSLESLRTISYGGSSMPVETLRRAMARFPHAEFLQGYGQTETSGTALTLDREAHRLAVTTRPELLVTSGQAPPFCVVRLVDDDMKDVAPGDVGEIVVKGGNVMKGYWRQPEATEEVFAGGWLHTGDLGRATPDGYIAIVDRKKDMIITGGENVYSREVEEIIASLPGVSEVAVVGIPDSKWGESICAVVVRAPGAEITQSDVVEICRTNLAGYKKPRSVVFWKGELPKNVAGKILKRELRADLGSTQRGA